jgi:hypothetical protein
MGSEGSDSDEYRRVFHENAAQAVKSGNQDKNVITFWPMDRSAKAQLWRSIT